MKNGSTLFLKAVVLGMGAAALALYIFAVPALVASAADMRPEVAFFRYFALVGWYATAIPFYFALYRTFRLLMLIDRGMAFSELSVKALKWIKYCAAAVSILWAAGLPVVYHLADVEDAPGIMLIGLVIAFVPIVIATFAAVLQRLLKQAVDIKSENDSTI
ncbi:MAG: DUF2975 domain-containing protein [Clostridiales bacterium]|nr:DUF2975 domain-containing protein [Clostridiales bacterium]